MVPPPATTPPVPLFSDSLASVQSLSAAASSAARPRFRAGAVEEITPLPDSDDLETDLDERKDRIAVLEEDVNRLKNENSR
jgi:hypothetical protein